MKLNRSAIILAIAIVLLIVALFVVRSSDEGDDLEILTNASNATDISGNATNATQALTNATMPADNATMPADNATIFNATLEAQANATAENDRLAEEKAEKAAKEKAKKEKAAKEKASKEKAAKEKAAKEKAGYLLESIGEKLGEVIEIHEIEEGNVYPMYKQAQYNVRLMADAAPEGDSGLEYQKIKYSYRMNATFRIK